jgi:peptide/nickel transport system substrate-binding protein
MPTGLSVAQDIDGARKLLKEAGFPKGIDITLHTSDAVSHILNIGLEFAQTVAPAGIRVTVQQDPPQNYWDQNMLSQHPYIDWWSRLDVIDYVGTLYRRGAPFNETDFSNSQFETLMNQATATPDPSASSGYLRDAMTVLSQKASQIIPGFSTEYLATSNHLQGVTASVRYIADFRDAYLT